MSALRLARAYTGRDKIVKFEGGYHGHADALLVSAGSGAAAHGVPTSAGVTASFARDTLVADYNDPESVGAHFRAAPGEIAAVIVEPVAANMGVVPPAPGFLENTPGSHVARGRAADIRRGRDRLSRRLRRRAATVRRDAGRHHPGQDHRRRDAGGRLRRREGDHGHRLPGRADVPGRDAVRQSGRHGRGHQDIGAAARAGSLRRVGDDGRAAGRRPA